MSKTKKEPQATYKPIPHRNRFWFNAENCYTEHELAFREWILKIRASSGIDADYLTNPSSWFSEDPQALININEHSWLFANAFKTRHVLSRDDFHVQPVDSGRLQWPPLYDLMQSVGDYLLLRNNKLPLEHLNQPMNYVFLDINFILKQLSQNPNIAQVKEQLELLNRYVRTIEKNTSPTTSSDRLFMANFRKVIDNNIVPQLTYQIETQLLKDKLNDLSKNIRKLSSERNRILHFALNINEVNPHSYDFSAPALEAPATYPTQVAKDCASNGKSQEISTDIASTLQLTVEQLKDCPNFKLISMNEEVLDHYAKSISDLNELDRFQKVINQIIDLLNQAGEVYTVYQFKEQMTSLLQQIEGFIDNSSHHIDAIINANTQAYHKAIEDEQNLSIWQKWLTSEQEKLKTFIKNQDTLAQFPSTTTDLGKTNKALKGQVNEMIRHLNQLNAKTSSFESLAGQAQQLNKLMLSMHQWIKTQHTVKGLEAPDPPKLLEPSPPIINTVSTEPSHSQIHYIPTNNNAFFNATSTPPSICPPDQPECQVSTVESGTTKTDLIYFGLIVLIPIGLILLYLYLYRGKDTTDEVVENGTEEEFDDLKVKFDDLLAIIQGLDDQNNQWITDEIEELLSDYDELQQGAAKGKYDVTQLKSLYQDLQSIEQALTKPAPAYY